MLSYKNDGSWLWYITRLRGSALVRIRFRLLAVFIVSVGLTFAHERTPQPSRFDLGALSLMGLALGIFLGFRNNTSYDRFWEGRKLWGSLVNTTRSLVREIIHFVEGPDAEVRAVHARQTYRLIAYVHALRMHLRDSMDVEHLSPWLSAEDRARIFDHVNVPHAIGLLLSDGFRRAAGTGAVSEYRLVELERRLVELTNIQGGCERIKSTPIPHSYSILIHRIVALYVFLVPVALVDSLHLYTPLVTLVVAYTFLGLDAVGSEIEDPFGTDLNDLPLSALSTMIEVNLRQSLGETEVPSLLQPVDGYLP